MKEYQVIGKAGNNTTTIPCGYVDPNHPSKTQLGPGVYSISNRSNVPYVAFVGASGYRKVITWGETVEVPEDQLVTVYNSSYHGGDIFINKGADECNRPSRITVPVQFTTVNIVITETTVPAFQCAWPCDTRGAKRAYLNIDAYVKTAAGPLSVFVRGRRLDGSMKTANSLGQFEKPFGPGVGYLSGYSFWPNTVLSYIPLGQGASLDDDSRPHNLLDASDAFLLFSSGSNVANSLDWPADKNVPEFPTAQATSPGAWFIVEYD